ncbi:MAG: hypothetical protein CMB80_28730 [Flammeovirgaceae bacterium]|nr:hypothetical protein [Flammeovirgaceae bacterium]
MFSKGASWKRVQKGGLTSQEIDAKYADRPTVRDAYVQSMKAIQQAINADPTNAERLLQGGQVVIETSIQMPGNPNTIVYDSPSIQFIQAVPLGPDVGEVDQAAYQRFISTAERVSQETDQDVQMGLVPYLKLQRSMSNDDQFASTIKQELDGLLSKTGLSKSNTIGDLAVHLLEKQLNQLDTVPPALKKKASLRLGTGNRSVLSKKEYVSKSSLEAWKDFQAIEKRRSDIVAEALIPLEKIIQMMGVYAFRNLEFAIASNTHESGEELRQFVGNVKSAFEQSRLISDPKMQEKIRVTLARIGDRESMFEKAVEGIVFQWRGKTRKLTGLFTPINKLRGFFAYGASPAKIQESRLHEGGNAFRDSSGQQLTVPIPQKFVKSTLDHFAQEVLQPSGVPNYVPIGSTGKKDLAGDLDIAIPIPPDEDIKAYKAKLLSSIKNIVGSPSIKKVGANLAVAYPIIGMPHELVQIDLMFAKDLPSTAWLMMGQSSDKVKGVYRNLLLSLIAKRVGDAMSSSEERVKLSIAYPAGMTIKKNNKIAGEKITNPSDILKTLQIDASPVEVESFEDLVQVLKKSPIHKSALPEFSNYIGWALRSDPDNAQQAIDYITTVLSETFRQFVHQVLRG